MRTQLIEVTIGQYCWSKFMVQQLDQADWDHRSEVGGGRLLMGQGHGPNTLIVMDLETCEGGMFNPSNFAPDVLRKHQLWVSPLFTPFLEWLFEQHRSCDKETPFDVRNLPSLVDFADRDTSSGSGERPRSDGRPPQALPPVFRQGEQSPRSRSVGEPAWRHICTWSGTHAGTIPGMDGLHPSGLGRPLILYLLDYNGTLDTLPDPVAFIESLQEQDPDCAVVVVSGKIPPRRVQKAADAFWMKPFPLIGIDLLKPDQIVMADDDPPVLRACGRSLARIAPVTLLAPEGLPSLLRR